MLKSEGPTVTVANFFPEESLRMDSAASDDATRYHLQGVRIEFSPCVRLIATNGHVMAIQRIPMHDDAWEPVRGLSPFTIPMEFFKALRKVKQRERSAVQITIGPKTIGFSLYGNVQTFTAIDGEFPDYTVAIPKTEREELVVRFNPELLLALTQALGRTTGAKLSIPLTGNGPIRVETSDQCFGLLMPMRA